RRVLATSSLESPIVLTASSRVKDKTTSGSRGGRRGNSLTEPLPQAILDGVRPDPTTSRRSIDVLFQPWLAPCFPSLARRLATPIAPENSIRAARRLRL